MAKTHVIQAGESLARIANQHGLTWQTVWNAPENNELRQLRGGPNILEAADQLTIPELTKKVVTLATGKRHRLVIKTQKSPIRLRLSTPAGEPRAGLSFEVHADGRVLASGETDDDGICAARVPIRLSRVEFSLCPYALRPGKNMKSSPRSE